MRYCVERCEGSFPVALLVIEMPAMPLGDGQVWEYQVCVSRSAVIMYIISVAARYISSGSIGMAPSDFMMTLKDGGALRTVVFGWL